MGWTTIGGLSCAQVNALPTGSDAQVTIGTA